MGSYIYEYLNDSLILDESLIEENYSGITEVRLSKELSDYRDFCIKNLGSIESDIKEHNSHLSSMASEQFSNIDLLKRAALYMDQMVIPDPIFPFTQPSHEISNTLKAAMELKSNDSIDRASLAQSAKKVISMRPMVAGNFIKYYPSSLHSEPPAEIPGGYSEVAFSDLLPAPIMDFFRDRAIVKSLIKSEHGFRVTDSLEVCRSIGLTFEGQETERMEIYNLFEKKILSYDKTDDTYKLAMFLPKTLPDKQQFNLWVKQSIHRSAYEYYIELAKQVGMSFSLNSAYTCGTELDANLLSSYFFSPDKTIKENTANCVLNFDLPFLCDVSASDIMSIRQNDGDEFHNFRVELEHQLKGLRNENDEEVIKNKLKDIEHEIFEVQVQRINSKIKSVRKTAIADAGIAIVGLSASIATSGYSLLGAFAALTHGAKTYAEYQEKVKENPAFFAWKLKGKIK